MDIALFGGIPAPVRVIGGVRRVTGTGRGAGRVLGMASTEDVARDGGAAAPLDGEVVGPIDRDVISVTGPEAETFLQGQLSQDVAALAVGARAYSFLLEPTGKVAALLVVTREGDESFLLDVEAGFGDAVVARLSRFKLRTKATIERVADVAPTTAAADPTVSEAWRIEQGLPKLGAELIPGETIPAEAGQWLIDAAVSFTKGCYTGQELVARIDSRGGNVPRHQRGLVIDAPADALPPTGAEVVAGDKVVGTLTSVAWSPASDRAVALAMIARAVEPPAEAEVRWDGGNATATIAVLPLTP
jgi:folate-binding protein YgfZ